MIIDISVKRKLPFHLWFHPHDLGHNTSAIKKRINRLLTPLLKYVERMKKDGKLSFETMCSVLERLRKPDSRHKNLSSMSA